MDTGVGRRRRDAYFHIFLLFVVLIAHAPAARCVRRAQSAASRDEHVDKSPGEEVEKVGSFGFYMDLTICIVLVTLAGLMSGLTLGLMGLDLNMLEILLKHGTPEEKHCASKILPLVKRHHLSLVTLLLTNACAMEALPIFLERLVPPWAAIFLSVTAVLLFGEIIPQAIFSRWALRLGGKTYWIVWCLIYISWPISWPISKLLDYVIGEKIGTLYKRNQLKEFVGFHAAKAFEFHGPRDGNNSSGAHYIELNTGTKMPSEDLLTEDEVVIIKGVLDLASKTVESAMTPLNKVFSLSITDNIDANTMQIISHFGHSRIPLWEGRPSNLVGMLLVKTLTLKFILEGGKLQGTDFRKELPLFNRNILLYTALNLFQTGKSHMAGVIDQNGEAIGIITLEDIIEEMIQEEIEDEMDVKNKERIAALISRSSKPQLEVLTNKNKQYEV